MVDDDADDRYLSQFAFRKLNLQNHHSLEFLTTGQELIDRLILKTDIEFPDLILLDLNMPGKNGLETLSDIKSNQTLKHLIITIFSTSDYQKDKAEAIERGAKNYIIKPTGLNKLMMTFEKILTI